MEAAWSVCKQAILYAKSLDDETFPIRIETLAMGKQVTARCQKAYETFDDARPSDEISDKQLMRLVRYTDGVPLKDYQDMFDVVPELVNVVTVCRCYTVAHMRLDDTVTPTLTLPVGRGHPGQRKWCDPPS
jgi:hypothetical protein